MRWNYAIVIGVFVGLQFGIFWTLLEIKQILSRGRDLD